LTHQCAGITRSGERCTHAAKGPSGFCHLHDPDRAAERKRNASRAGKSTGGREIRDLKHRISEVVEAVLDGSQDRGRAAVAIQGFNSLRGVLELERKVREVDELEARIEQLEQVNGSGREKRWGA
jgi:hypothetical protein